jgi:hypothetical protein
MVMEILKLRSQPRGSPVTDLEIGRRRNCREIDVGALRDSFLAVMVQTFSQSFDCAFVHVFMNSLRQERSVNPVSGPNALPISRGIASRRHRLPTL